MRILYYFSIFFLFTAFLCESEEPTETLDLVIASLEAAPGEIVIETDGGIARLLPVQFAGSYLPSTYCTFDGVDTSRLYLNHHLENPDGSRLVIQIFVRAFELDRIEYAEFPELVCEDFVGMKERIIVNVIYSSAPGVTEQFYSSKIELGATGYIEFTDFTAPICCTDVDGSLLPDEDLFGFVSGHFDLLLHERDDASPLLVRGVINLAPLSYVIRDPFRDF